MLLQTMIAEFEQEVENTRKLLGAVPQKDLHYKPSDISWSMGQLCQHIATVYYWYVGVFTKDVYDITKDSLQRGNVYDIAATQQLFEDNVALARAALQSATDESLQQYWTMKVGDKTVLGPMPRGVVARSFVFNHIYHHRGELVIHLRATGNKVPGLYGPTYEDEVTSGRVAG